MATSRQAERHFEPPRPALFRPRNHTPAETTPRNDAGHYDRLGWIVDYFLSPLRGWGFLTATEGT
jgi:hypothetical protein